MTLQLSLPAIKITLKDFFFPGNRIVHTLQSTQIKGLVASLGEGFSSRQWELLNFG